VAYGGRNYADIPIELPYPRLQTDRAVAGLQADILEVFNEMESQRKQLDPRLATNRVEQV
jgi:hypothetical protein